MLDGLWDTWQLRDGSVAIARRYTSAFWSVTGKVRIMYCLHVLVQFNLGLYNAIFIYEPGQRSRYSDWLRAGRPRAGSSSPGRVKKFLFSTSSRPALGPTQPFIELASGALSPGLKRPGREADHSLPASAEFKKTWIYTSTAPYIFMA
jgi:hypothetical protein